MDEAAVIARYDALLSSVGERAGDIGTRPVVTHWPQPEAGAWRVEPVGSGGTTETALPTRFLGS